MTLPYTFATLQPCDFATLQLCNPLKPACLILILTALLEFSGGLGTGQLGAVDLFAQVDVLGVDIVGNWAAGRRGELGRLLSRIEEEL